MIIVVADSPWRMVGMGCVPEPLRFLARPSLKAACVIRCDPYAMCDIEVRSQRLQSFWNIFGDV